MKKPITVFSTFSGIGGFEKGMIQALGKIKVVGYSEIDKHAVQVYQSHFPKHKNYGDITKIDERGLPDFELLCGGFPCQSFSIAGKRGGFEDTRGTLFFDIARIAKHKKPRLLLLENVKGLLSHDGGRTFNTIIAALDELGYDVQWQVLNSKHFGVPQNRERVLIIGHLRGTPRPEVFPIGEDGYKNTEIQGQFSNTLTARYEKSQAVGTYIVESELDAEIGTLRTHKSGQGFRKMKNNVSPALSARARQDGSGQAVVRIPEATKKGYTEARLGQSINLAVMGSKTRRGRVSDVAQTLDTGMQQHTLDRQGGVRRLTPIECERLQGFPDDWTCAVSDTQRYKTLGNAVTVNVIQAVVERLFHR